MPTDFPNTDAVQRFVCRLLAYGGLVLCMMAIAAWFGKWAAVFVGGLACIAVGVSMAGVIARKKTP